MRSRSGVSGRAAGNAPHDKEQDALKKLQRVEQDRMVERKRRAELEKKLERTQEVSRTTRLQLVNENLVSENEQLRKLLAAKEEELEAERLASRVREQGMQLGFELDSDERAALLAESRRTVSSDRRDLAAKAVLRAPSASMPGRAATSSSSSSSSSTTARGMLQSVDCAGCLPPVVAAAGLGMGRSGAGRRAPRTHIPADTTTLSAAALQRLVSDCGLVSDSDSARGLAMLPRAQLLKALEDERTRRQRADTLAPSELSVRELKAWLREHSDFVDPLAQRACVEKQDLVRLVERTRFAVDGEDDEDGDGGMAQSCAIS